MTERKELDLEELDKVTGGTSEVYGVTVYSPNEIVNLSIDTRVTVYEYLTIREGLAKKGQGKIKQILAQAPGYQVKVEFDNGATYIGVTNKDCQIGPIGG